MRTWAAKIERLDENLGGKMDRMLQKQDDVLLEVKDVAKMGMSFLSKLRI